MELAKLALAEVVAKKQNKTVSSGYFCSLDAETGRIGFSFFLEGQPEPCYQGTRLEVYEKSLEIARAFESDELPEDGFVKIDTPWASETLHRYQARV